MQFLTSFFQSFNSWEVFLFSLVFMTVCLVFHNALKNAFSGLVICIAYTFFAALFMPSNFLWVLFFIGGFSYFVIDTVAVATKEWKYNTKSGYVLWAFPGWGFLTIIISHLLAHFDALFLITLLVISGALIAVRIKKEVQELNLEFGMIVSILICAVIMPKVFLISFGMGTIIEYLAVQVFKTWKYRHLTFLQIGLGYGALVVSSFMIFNTIQGHFSLAYLAVLLGLLIFQVKYFVKVGKNPPKKKKS